MAQKLERGATGANKRKAGNLVKELKLLIADRARGQKGKVDDAMEEDTTRPVSPVQVVWAHDAEVGSVQSGATYQYRMRVFLYNRYAAAPDELKDPRDAEKPFIIGPWSEPSGAVKIPLDTRFFLTKGTSDGSAVTVEVFKWFEGYWLNKKFKVGIGERIGGVKRAQLPGEKPLVDFDTGAVVVDIEREHPFRRRDSAKDGSFDFEKLAGTLALVYAGVDGSLHKRLLGLDKKSPAYDQMKESAYKPERIRKTPAKPKSKRRSGSRGGSRGGGRGGGGRGGGGGGLGGPAGGGS